MNIKRIQARRSCATCGKFIPDWGGGLCTVAKVKIKYPDFTVCDSPSRYDQSQRLKVQLKEIAEESNESSEVKGEHK
jgi:hypothetical protein